MQYPMNMNLNRLGALAGAALLSALLAPATHAGCSTLGALDWQTSGPNAAAATGPTAVSLSYLRAEPSYEPATDWSLTATAAATETITFDWTYTGFHGWFADWAELTAFADGPEGTTYVSLVATPQCEFCPDEIDGPFAFSGSSALQVHAGYSFGILVRGANFDCCSELNGTVTLACNDQDGDGTLDAVDSCPNSDLRPTVVIGGCDSGVPNTLFPGGCTIADMVAQCAAGAKNHGAFVSCVAALSNALNAQGVITGKQKGAIQKCAAQAAIP